MANLNSTCELAWLQLFPNPTDETAISKQEFQESGRLIYAWEMWRQAKEEKREEGLYNVPSNLLTQVDVEITDGEADISKLNILRSLTDDTWLVNIGGLLSKCKYIASNVNLTQLLDDDDSLPDDSRTYVVIGKKILFPKGVHTNPLPIIYANNGLSLDGETVEVEDSIAAIVRTKLIDLYGRRGQEDLTNNSAPDK